MEFERRKGFVLKTNPQIVGEVCQGLEQGGKLTPKNLVDASRDVNAPLHNEFEWRDGVAAEKYREVQAGYIIRSVVVKISQLPITVTQMKLKLTDVKEPTVRFFHATERDNSYDSIETVSNNDEKRIALLKDCFKDIAAFKEKYNVLRSVLPKLFQSIDETMEGKAI